MTRALRATWTVLIFLFVVMIPIQFYLAGHGAMEGAHAAAKSTNVMTTAFDPHAAFGTLMILVSLLILLAGFAARPPRQLLMFSAALFVSMIVQFILPAAFNDSSSTRWIAALHGVNALIVTGLAIMLALRSRDYLPFKSGGQVAVEDHSLTSARSG